ncbi:N-acetylmuramoyl-L-alanine amidase [Alkaliphilus peptidifermentans]|uniref:N-acetylmuramoyl-L-alanine amidase n=1 Tax=Alkaliphilus peptidifermentans DSM 18978 TaxID=1120976 RepID=A0A1G5ECY8_9FIRM|nr:N-acetylmuramoyl-L-alanine amidase [Alkaliphilus peptidifermentans]SCY24836.1 N-acetylmuramoyl-L-alanine amidase [Alkaliphilus peptidifermentans DSM 18978]
MARLCFDYGHGGSYPGAVYKGRKESEDNLSIGMEVAKELRRHGIEIDEIRTTDVAVSLKQRSEFENKGNYDYFISFHRNAFKPEVATGAETFVYTKASAKSKVLAEKIQNALVGVGFINRGVKTASFHVLREIKAPAVLVEMGFIDNTKDNNLFDSKRKEIVMGITKAILAQLRISYKEDLATGKTDGQVLYRVMAGSYGVRDNAEKQVQRLKTAGFDATIMVFNR